jgi:Tol biopolymer transport system component
MKKVLTVVMTGFLAIAVALAQSRPAADLYQDALRLEEVNGDLKGAIEQYKKLAEGSDKAIAAKALLRMAACYETLGQNDAKAVYERILRDFAGQTEAATEARARLASITGAAPAAGKTAMTVRQVWTGVGDANAISRDGRYLAYVGGGVGLTVRDLVAGEERHLTLPDADHFIFSPDGRSIAYRCKKCANGGHDQMRLIALDGSAARVLNVSYDGPVLFPIEWASDGKHLLAGATNQNGNRQLVFASVADGSVQVVMTLEEWGSYGGVGLSPDGRYIAYAFTARKGATERDVFIRSTDGGREVPLVTQPSDDTNPLWTPDGGVLFLSARAGSTGAWFLPIVDGKPQGSPELVKRDVGPIVPIGFTRNGSLYYKEWSAMADLYTATFDPASGTITGQPATVTPRLVIQSGEVWSPNGQYLAYSSRRASVQGEVGARIIVIRSVQTGEEYELAPALRSFDLQDWSPDSRSLLVVGPDKDGRVGAYRVDALTGEVALLAMTAPIGSGYDTANWFANGKSIVFGRSNNPGGGGRSIVERDLETGRETEWYRAPASLHLYYVEAAADGRHLAFILRDPDVKAAGASLMIMAAAGETPRKLDLRLKGSDEVDSLLGFTPDGRQVLFNSFDPGQKERGYKYWRIAVDGGADPQEIRLNLDRPIYTEQMSFHPDGRRIAFTGVSLHSSSKSAVWVLENFLPKTGAGR